MSHPTGVGIENAGMVNTPVDFLFEPRILPFTQLAQMFLEFQNSGELE